MSLHPHLTTLEDVDDDSQTLPNNRETYERRVGTHVARIKEALYEWAIAKSVRWHVTEVRNRLAALSEECPGEDIQYLLIEPIDIARLAAFGKEAGGLAKEVIPTEDRSSDVGFDESHLYEPQAVS